MYFLPLSQHVKEHRQTPFPFVDSAKILNNNWNKKSYSGKFRISNLLIIKTFLNNSE